MICHYAVLMCMFYSRDVKLAQLMVQPCYIGSHSMHISEAPNACIVIDAHACDVLYTLLYVAPGASVTQYVVRWSQLFQRQWHHSRIVVDMPLPDTFNTWPAYAPTVATAIVSCGAGLMD